MMTDDEYLEDEGIPKIEQPTHIETVVVDDDICEGMETAENAPLSPLSSDGEESLDMESVEEAIRDVAKREEEEFKKVDEGYDDEEEKEDRTAQQKRPKEENPSSLAIVKKEELTPQGTPQKIDIQSIMNSLKGSNLMNILKKVQFCLNIYNY